MIYPDLAKYANFAVYSAMILFALALVTFTLHLSSRTRLNAARATAPVAAKEPVAVGAGAGAGSVADRADTAGSLAIDAGAEQAKHELAASKARKLAATALNFTYLGTLAVVAAVVLRGISVGRPPTGNLYEFTVAACAAASVVYSVLAVRNKWEWLGAFVIGPVLLLLMLAVAVFYTDGAELMPALKSVWLGIHVSIAIIAVGFFTVAFSLGLLQLAQDRASVKAAAASAEGVELKRSKLGDVLASIPGAQQLERMAYGLNIVGFILWTFTLITGSIWAQKAWGAYWQWDPKEVCTFVIWVVYAAYLHSRATAGWQNKRSTYIAIAGFVCIILNFTVVNLLPTFGGMHNYSGM